MNPDGPLGRDRTVIWRGRAAEDAYQPGGLFVASHHTAGYRRNRSVSAGGALCRGDVCQSEQGRRSECQMDHFGFHVAALAKLDPVVRVIRTQKIVYANSARSSSPLVPEFAQTFEGVACSSRRPSGRGCKASGSSRGS